MSYTFNDVKIKKLYNFIEYTQNGQPIQERKFSLGQRINKQDILEAITQFSRQAHELGSYILEIFYSGHGLEPDSLGLNGGNWVTNDGNRINLREVFMAVKEGGFCNRLDIVSNCCHAGFWPE